MHATQAAETFHAAFRGEFAGILSWPDLDVFWQAVRDRAAAGWYLYAVGETVPTLPSTAAQVHRFVSEIDALLRAEHREEYCGIVYADSRAMPSMIKIFDPNNLGVQCGYSTSPPLPGWVMSLLPPDELRESQPLAANRRRWWQRLWA